MKRQMPKKRLSALAKIAVWEKVTKGLAGIRWDGVVDEVWKEITGIQEDTVHGEVWGAQDRRKTKDRKKRKASMRQEGGRGRAYRDLREIKRRDWYENIFPWPNRLRENAETALSCRGPGTTRKNKEVYQ